MLYELSTRRYFKEVGKTLAPGQTIELPEDVADEILRNEGPVFKPARMTTQATPEVVSSATAKRKIRARK